MKKCPYCAEEIQDEAILCRYCKSDLTVAPPNQAPAAGAPSTTPSTTATSTPSSTAASPSAGSTRPAAAGAGSTGEVAEYGGLRRTPEAARPAGSPASPASPTPSATERPSSTSPPTSTSDTGSTFGGTGAGTSAPRSGGGSDPSSVVSGSSGSGSAPTPASTAPASAAPGATAGGGSDAGFAAAGAPSASASAAAESIVYTHTGQRYVLGYGGDYFGIWDRQSPAAPAERFPRSDEGWGQAWTRYSAIEPDSQPVATTQPTQQSAPAVSTPTISPSGPAQSAPAASPAASSTGAVTATAAGGEAMQYTHSGQRYLLGYGTDFFGIWDRQQLAQPVQRFPRSDDGWRAAWQQFAAWEPHSVEVGIGGA